MFSNCFYESGSIGEQHAKRATSPMWKTTLFAVYKASQAYLQSLGYGIIQQVAIDFATDSADGRHAAM